EKAFATDKQAPFGGIIVCNRPLTESLAKVISEIFSEVIIAPDFQIEARAVLQKKKEPAPDSVIDAAEGSATNDRSAFGLRRRAGSRRRCRWRADDECRD